MRKNSAHQKVSVEICGCSTVLKPSFVWLSKENTSFSVPSKEAAASLKKHTWWLLRTTEHVEIFQTQSAQDQDA